MRIFEIRNNNHAVQVFQPAEIEVDCTNFPIKTNRIVKCCFQKYSMQKERGRNFLKEVHILISNTRQI